MLVLRPGLLSLVVLFACAFAVQVVAWLVLAVGFARARHHSALPNEAETTLGETEAPHEPQALPFTVIVAARNEAAQLPSLLDALAAQTLPPAEVLVADDGSADATAALAGTFADRLPLRVLSIPNGAADAAGLPRKKHALATAIAAAQHDRLAFTDADCVPPPHWLAAFAKHAHVAPDAVLIGHSPTRRAADVPGAPPWLATLVRFETFVTAFLTVAALGLGRPYMAVGRSLSYPRSLFDRLGGFAHQAASLSGDDDLLVQEVHRRRAAPIRTVLDAPVPTDPPPTLGAWLRQKRRHTSAGRFYDRMALALLAGFHLTHGLVWLGVPVLWGLHGESGGSWTGAGLLAILLLVQRGVLRRPAEALDTEDVMPAWPLWMWGYALYNSFVAPLGGLGARRW